MGENETGQACPESALRMLATEKELQDILDRDRNYDIVTLPNGEIRAIEQGEQVVFSDMRTVLRGDGENLVGVDSESKLFHEMNGLPSNLESSYELPQQFPDVVESNTPTQEACTFPYGEILPRVGTLEHLLKRLQKLSKSSKFKVQVSGGGITNKMEIATDDAILLNREDLSLVITLLKRYQKLVK